MNRTSWEAEVTRLVDEMAGPNFGWDDVAESEWDALWLRRLTPQEAAHEFMTAAPQRDNDPNADFPYTFAHGD